MDKKKYFFKGTVDHNHIHGCSKCTVVGSLVSETMVYPSSNAAKRTNEDFRNGLYLNGHQKLRSLILDLRVDLIDDFPIGDSLHLLDTGITKRLVLKNYVVTVLFCFIHSFACIDSSIFLKQIVD